VHTPRPPSPPSSPAGAPRPGSNPDSSKEGLDPLARAALHEVTEVLRGLEDRAALAGGGGSSPGWAAGELRRIREEAQEFRSILELLTTERGESPSTGRQRFSLSPLVEGAVDRWLPSSPGILATYRSALPEGASVAGPPALLGRALRTLLRVAARRARSRIRIVAGVVEGGVEGSEAGAPGEPGMPPTPARAELVLTLDGAPLETGEGEVVEPALRFARWCIRQLGGRLEGPLPADPAQGSTSFRILLPLATRLPGSDRRGRSWRSDSGGAGPLEGVSIHVVDDEPALRSVLARLLHRSGATVSTLAPELGDPAPALARRILSDAPDLVLLDLHLGRISGRTLLELLQVEGGPCVLILTGDPSGAEDLPCPVIPKPVDWPFLMGRMLDLLAERR
jgi:CheY-like chemotaxis protein